MFIKSPVPGKIRGEQRLRCHSGSRWHWLVVGLGRDWVLGWCMAWHRWRPGKPQRACSSLCAPAAPSSGASLSSMNPLFPTCFTPRGEPASLLGVTWCAALSPLQSFSTGAGILQALSRCRVQSLKQLFVIYEV